MTCSRKGFEVLSERTKHYKRDNINTRGSEGSLKTCGEGAIPTGRPGSPQVSRVVGELGREHPRR